METPNKQNDKSNQIDSWVLRQVDLEFSLAYTVRPCLRERFEKKKRGEMNVLSSGRKMAPRLSVVTALAEDKQAGGLQPLRIPAPGESDAPAFVLRVHI